MRSAIEYEEVDRWVRLGLNDSQISRLTSIPRGTIRDWRHRGRPGSLSNHDGPICGGQRPEPRTYAYLLGLYLGDGCISLHRRAVYRLRIVMDHRYPAIIDECEQAMATIRPSGSMRVGKVQRVGCIEINAYWKHWPCLFPRHGSGRKHERTIELLPWQREIASTEPAPLLRGLIHSDGYRGLNWVNGKGYPRYQERMWRDWTK
jgi:hypothetical protein